MINIPLPLCLHLIALQSSRCYYCGLYSVFLGRFTNYLWPLHSARTILLSSIHRILCHFSLGPSMCSLANCNLFNTSFFSSGTLRGFLVNSLASHWRLLIVKVLTGKWRSSLIALELIIGCFFAILVIPWCTCMVVFLFLPDVSGFVHHFKAFEVILVEPIICCTSFICFPLSNQLFDQSSFSVSAMLKQSILLSEQGLKPGGTTSAAFLP